MLLRRADALATDRSGARVARAPAGTRLMFIPLHDANSLKRIRLQFVTIGLIAVNLLAFLLTTDLTGETMSVAQVAFGFIPVEFAGGPKVFETGVAIPENLTLVSYAFLHGDWLHLGGNMLFLWVFGDNVEDAMGHLRFLVFYLLCAALAAAGHSAVDTGSGIPLIGASGAVAGVIGAYLVLHPKVKVWVLALGRIPMRVPAWIALGAWIAFQLVMFVAAGEEAVSWAAHIAGFAAGALLVMLFKRRDVPLLDSTIVLPKAVIIAPAPASAKGAAAEPAKAEPAAGKTKWGRGS
jgi:membrane associated rhomboid family serine protease